MPPEITGVLPLIKPAGPSSAAVVERVRRLTGVRRVGHAGTLDPAADGVLVLAFGRATGCFPFLPTEKAYRAVIRLGSTTDTLDSQGKVLQVKPVPELNREQLLAHLPAFLGKIQQRPPLVSALHHQGRRLYDIARSGESFEPPLRAVEILKLELQAMALPMFTLDVECSRGTYIRSLARDLGDSLGCGAHLAGLTRTFCSGFSLAEALSLDALELMAREKNWTEKLIGIGQALRHLPELRVDESGRIAVLNGRPVPALGWDEGRKLRITDSREQLLSVAEISGRMAVSCRVFGAAAQGERE